MKVLHLTLLLFLGITATVHAQDVDDDMYFVSSKKKAAKAVVKAPRTYSTSSSHSAWDNSDADADYHTGQLRDTDEYNRRGNRTQDDQVVTRLVNDTLFVYTNDSTGQQVRSYGNEYDSPNRYYDEDEYVYAIRLGRYHSVHIIDPWYWDYTYGWYDPWYDPWYAWNAPYYRPGFYWGWYHRPAWSFSWGYGPYYPYYHHHYHPHYHGGYVYHRPSNPVYRNGGQRSALSSGRAGTSYSRYGSVRPSDSRSGSVGRGSRGNTVTTREGYVPRSQRGTTRTESSSRGYSQSSRSNESYRSSSSSSSRSSSMGSYGGSRSGSFGGGSRGGGFGGGGGFGSGGRGGGAGGSGRGGR